MSLSNEEQLAAPVLCIHDLETPEASPREHPLQGLYLHAPLDTPSASKPFVFANFIASLDGRIAAEGEPRTRVPAATMNLRDWRLFQELGARADCLLTTGRYFRELTAGTAQHGPPLDERFPDLAAWRVDQGLPAQPDLAVMTRTADFTLPPELLEERRRVWVLAAPGAPAEALRAHERAGAGVLEPHSFAETLPRLGYQRIYSAGGPQIAHTLMAEGVLDSLFLTLRHRAIGGEAYDTVVEGPRLARPFDARLRWAYLDTAVDGPGQQFLRYDRIHDNDA